MQNTRLILFFLALGTIPLGLFLKLKEIQGGSELAAASMLTVLCFFIFRILKDFRNKNISFRKLVLQTSIILMLITFFSKYFYHRFWDIPTLFIVPLFVFSTILWFLKTDTHDAKLVITCILFSIL